MQYRRRRSALRIRAQIAHACAVLASYLRVGQVPTAALALAAADCECFVRAIRPYARRGCRAGLAAPGAPAGTLWSPRARAGLAGFHGDRRPMSSTLNQVAASLAADQALTQVVNSELAAARATGKVMVVLPGCGIGIGYLLGGDPARWLLAGPAGWACLLVGVVLACAGVLWIEALARQASTGV